jgi:hypothetical protein
MKTFPFRYLAVCFFAFAAIFQASAESSATSISFQGALSGTTGQPLPNGSCTLTFQFWDHPTGTAASNCVGNAVTVPGVVVSGGVASTAIPVHPDCFNGQTRYLGTTVQGVNASQELLPRELVTAVPYAVASSKAKSLVADSGEEALFDSRGFLGINTHSPRDSLHVAPSLVQAAREVCFLTVGPGGDGVTQRSMGVRGFLNGRAENQAFRRGNVLGEEGD